MYNKLLSFLENGLGGDSKTFLFIESLFNKVGPENFLLIMTLISLVIISTIVYQLFWGRFKRFKGDRQKRVSSYGDYIEREKFSIFLYLSISTTLVTLFFAQGLGIDILSGIISWGSDDGTNYSGIAIVFGYKTDSAMYQYYNIGRYLVALILFFFTVYIGVMHYTIGTKVKNNGETVIYWPLFKNGLIALTIFIILLFSTLVDGFLNLVVSTLGQGDLHQIIQGDGGSKL